MQIQIYDTTLRDGTQSEGFNLSANDKVRIAQKLDEIGVAFIEGGWPGSNPKDVEFFERARDMQWKNSLIAAFGSTCRVKGGPEDDANIKALIDSHTPVCTIFGKSSTLHVKEVLLTTNEDNLRIIEQSVAYLKANGKARDLRCGTFLRRLQTRCGVRARDVASRHPRRRGDGRVVRYKRRHNAVGGRINCQRGERGGSSSVWDSHAPRAPGSRGHQLIDHCSL